MFAFCPTITTKLAASCPLAFRNNPHLMLSTWAWLSGWTNVPQEQLCSGYKKQTAREFGYMSECERRLMTWFKMELGLVCDFTSIFYCVFMSTDFFIHVLDHSSPSFSHDDSFFPCLFPPHLVFPHPWLTALLMNSALSLNSTCVCPSPGLLWTVSSLMHTLSSPHHPFWPPSLEGSCPSQLSKLWGLSRLSHYTDSHRHWFLRTCTAQHRDGAG